MSSELLILGKEISELRRMFLNFLQSIVTVRVEKRIGRSILKLIGKLSLLRSFITVVVTGKLIFLEIRKYMIEGLDLPDPKCVSILCTCKLRCR